MKLVDLKWKDKFLVSLFFGLLTYAIPDKEFSSKNCVYESDRLITINENADIFLSVFLDVSKTEITQEKCTNFNGEIIAQFESLRWMLQRLNKNFGQIGDRIIQDTFIPGIELGLRIYDTCGDQIRMLTFLETEFPEIGNLSSTCAPKNEASFLTFGVLDFTGMIAENQELSTLLKGHGIPALSFKPGNLTVSQDRAKAVLSLVSQFGWQEVSLIAEETPTQLRLAQDLSLLSKSFNICISDVARVPSMNIDGQDVESVIAYKLHSKLLMNDAIVIAASKLATIYKILETLRDKYDPKKRSFPHILLSDQPSKSLDSEFIQLIHGDLWIVSYFPLIVSEFDATLKSYRNINNIKKNKENQWIMNYLEEQNNCSFSSENVQWKSCSNVNLNENKLFSLRSSTGIYTALHGMAVMTNAVKQAWRIKCSNRRGLCEALRNMKKAEFTQNFLVAMELRHSGPGSRTPTELTGVKVKKDSFGSLHGMAFGLYRLFLNKTGTVNVNEVLKATPSKVEIISNEDYNMFKATEEEEKANCDTAVFEKDFWEVQKSVNRFSILEKIEFKLEKHIFIPSSDDIVIAGMFPIHYPSEDGSDCNDTINEESMQDVEAFLWAVDQINKHKKLLPQTTLGVLVLDTCDSSIRAINQVTNLVKNFVHGFEVNSSHILCVVTSLEPTTAKVAGDILASLNITTINLGTADTHNPFILQMKPSINHEAEAIVQILRHIGWDYVSLITSIDDFEANIGGNAFKNIAKASRVCVANEIKLKGNVSKLSKMLIEKLKAGVVQGARGVVAFLTASHLQLLLQSHEAAVKDKIISVGDFIFIGSANWGDQKHKFYRYNETLGSVLLLEDGQLDVIPFTLFYQLLSTENNVRNPWFEEFWNQQNFQCSTSGCATNSSHSNPRLSVIRYFHKPSTPRVIQAVFSFGAALTQLLQHLCPHVRGKLCPGLPMWRQRTVLNEFLRNTEVSRVDNPPEYFQFSDNFHGNTPLEIVNLKKSKGNSVEYVKIGRYVNSRLSMALALGNFMNGTSFALDSVPSSCEEGCQLCDDQNIDYVFVDSKQKIFLLAIFEIHERGQNLLECGSIKSDQGIQNVESLLWALKKINEYSQFELGAIIFDTCNSKDKVGRDLANLFTGRIPEKLKAKIPTLDNIIGIITGSKGEVMTRILDITEQYHLSIIATQSSQSSTKDQFHSSLITLSASNAAYARSVSSLINLWKWSTVSVVYSDFGDSKDISEFLFQELSESTVKLSMNQAIPEKNSSIELMLDIWSRLAKGTEKGTKVIILLLETPHEILFLQTASKLVVEGLIKQGDFIYITSKSLRPFVKTDTEALGSLTIQPMNGFFSEFANYFQSLSLANRTFPYPWFQEFWSLVHNCRGASCYDNNEAKFINYPFRQAKGVVETFNAVMLLHGSFQNTLQQACIGNLSCATFAVKSQFKSNILNLTQNSKFKGVDDQQVLIDSEGYNSAATLQILNYKFLDNLHSGLVRVGLFNDINGLSINESQTFTYSAKGDPIPYKNIQSFEFGESIIDQVNVSSVAVDSNIMKNEVSRNFSADDAQGNNFMQMYSKQRFGISILLPLHLKATNFFSCGDFFSDSVFQNLVAVAYALSEMNKKSPEVGIGAIAFDFCDRTEKAREQLFRYFSGDLQNSFTTIEMVKERIVAHLDFSDKAAEAVWTILSSNHIPQFTSSAGGWEVKDRSIPSIMSSIPSRSAELRIYISLLKTFKWNYVSIIYDNDRTGQAMVRLFREFARKENICIGDSLPVPKRVSQEYSQELVETLNINWKPKVVVLLIDDSDNVRTLLDVFNSRNQSENFIFLSGNAWGNKMAVTNELHRISSGAITITLETYDLPEFRLFLSNLSLVNHEPINKRWFEEYFQHKYQCKLSGSRYPSTIFKRECSGTENTHPDDIIQDPFVFHTVLMVNTIVHGLDSYLRKNCATVKLIEECIIDQTELILHIKKFSSIYLNNTQDLNLYDQEGAFGYHIWNFRKIGREYGYINIGKWENGRLKIESSNVEFKIGPYAPESFCSRGQCLETCAFQSPMYAVKQIVDPLPIDHNFRTIYGIVASCLSLLGIVLILITLVYFMVLYPTIAGTSVLGYFIITGCLMLYAVNFAFIFQPTVGTCALRRFMMGLAYAIVYSSLLVKVMQSWRLANNEEDDIYANRPAILILVNIALIMVQVIIGITWLILYPPQVDLINDLYRCSPSESFEKDLIVSLIYVMMLNAITLIICAETWHSKDVVKDTRWVLLASSFTSFTWFIWALVATQAPISFRDPAIVIGNLVSATSVLIFLCARRSYIYSYLNKELKDLELKSQITAASYINHLSSHQKVTDLDILQPPPLNPISESMPGTQFIGEPEVSFRTVTLPPDIPNSGISERMNSHYRTSKRSIRSFSLPRDLPRGIANPAFESSEDDYDVNFVNPLSDEDENMSTSLYSGTDYEEISDEGLTSINSTSSRTAILAMRRPSLKRAGSRQMLVFLTDGNTFGQVSRI